MALNGLVGEIDRELHDLCQPLTRLSCHLELGQLLGDSNTLRGSVEQGMVECKNVCAAVTRMRSRLAELAGQGAEL